MGNITLFIHTTIDMFVITVMVSRAKKLMFV